MSLDGSPFQGGISAARSSAREWPGIVQGSIDQPLQQAAAVMGQVSNVIGGHVADVGNKLQQLQSRSHITARADLDASGVERGVNAIAGQLGQVGGKFDQLQNKSHISGKADLDPSGVEHGMLAAEAAMQLFPALVVELIENPILGAVAAAKEALTSLGEAVLEIGNHFKEINLGSIKSGLDPETFSTYSAAAKAAGVEVGTFTAGIELLQDRAANALRGDEGATKGFKDLGISAKELSGLLADPQQLLLRVADAMAAIETPGKKVQAAMESMGRGGKEMLPFLELGSAGIKEMAKNFGDLGSRVDSEEARLGGKFAQISQAASSMWEGIKTAFATPVLDYFDEHLSEILPTIESFASEVRDGIGEAVKDAIPYMESAFGFLQSLGDVFTSVLIPAFQVAQPLLEAIAEILKTIADLSAAAINSVAGVINSITGNSSGADANFARAGEASDRFMADVGVTQPDVVIQNVNVQLDPDRAGNVAAREINKHVDRAWSQYVNEQKGDRSADKVRAAMGKKRH